jgi:hypothetical protein
MKPAKTAIAAVLILALLGGPASASPGGQAGSAGQAGTTAQAVGTAVGAAQSPAGQLPLPGQPTQTQGPSPEDLARIRAAINRPPVLKVEDGQLRIYVQVIGNWPSFAEATKGFDYMNGPTGLGANPMSHAEFLNMVTPRDMYSSAGVKPAEIATMAVVNVVGQWAVAKAINKIATYRKEKQMRDIQEKIDAALAAFSQSKK